MARNGGTRQSVTPMSTTRGNRLSGEMLNAVASTSRAASVPTADDAGSSTTPITTKTTNARTNDGHDRPQHPADVLVDGHAPTKLGTSTVVSDSGDILSPM